MRTKLDLPDDLYKRLKLLAVREGKPLREIVLRCLEEGLNRQATSTAQPTLPVVPVAGRRIRACTHAELWGLLDEHVAS
jgi:hypothetical protein